MSEGRVIIVGAGPGGLTAAMLLAYQGFAVTVVEREGHVGGRNAALRLGEYTFDLGPTFLMMRFILDEMFEMVGRRSDDHLDFVPLEPMYRLDFADNALDVFSHREAAREREEIERVFPGKSRDLDAFYRRESRRYQGIIPSLRRGYSRWAEVLSPELIRATPHLALGKSLFDVLHGYFGDEKLALAFTFQAKYLGMSPWDCPGAFAIIPYIEHNFGMFHVKGGLNQISQVMADVAREDGAEIRLNAPVAEVLLEGRAARGVRLESGEEILADHVVMNADFAYAMSELVPVGVLKKYSRPSLARRDYSCSTFMMYLGLDKIYDTPHHRVVFAEDYRGNVEDIFKNFRLSEDFSVYIHNPSITDPTLAPEGHSALYLLVPVSNNRSQIQWDQEREAIRERVLQVLEERAGMEDIRQHIVEERVITPKEWQQDHHVYLGATFNLSHRLSQMLVFRPHNRFEELDNVFLVGGGTHPGSGLPTIYESARISARLIAQDAGRG